MQFYKNNISVLYLDLFYANVRTNYYCQSIKNYCLHTIIKILNDYKYLIEFYTYQFN